MQNALYLKKKKGCPADKFPKQESESELLNEKTMCSDLNEIPVRNPITVCHSDQQKLTHFLMLLSFAFITSSERDIK